jgi:hypothetical protein
VLPAVQLAAQQMDSQTQTLGFNLRKVLYMKKGYSLPDKVCAAKNTANSSIIIANNNKPRYISLNEELQKIWQQKIASKVSEALM